MNRICTISRRLKSLALTAGVALMATILPVCASAATSAFFYQTVNPAFSTVRAGTTDDGQAVSIYNVDLVNALDKAAGTSYGDPVFSRLSSGNWAMTGWTAPGDTRGSGLLYYEASCPKVVDSLVKVITSSSATGCMAGASTGAKTSQVFAVDGSNYVFVQSGGEIYLTRLTDATHSATDLQNICIRQTAATSFSGLAWGEATLVVSKALAANLLLSDTGIARRKDGVWVLFIKGIASDSGCAQGSICELCARNIYRTTSTDLITWSALEKVVSQASVPEAVTYPDGSVWLYHQNFAPACAANDNKVAQRAPITGVAEGVGNVMGAGVNVTFANESFEADQTLHYPTNGNPIALPDAAAKTALDVCMLGSVPGAPAVVAVTAGNSGAILSFTAPAWNGGSAITGYLVTCTPGSGGVAVTATGSSSPIAIQGLTNGVTYSCTLAALSSGGASAQSAALSVTPVTVPGAPAIGTATAGNAQATVTFTAPADNGGSAITGYTVKSSPAGGTDSNAGSTGLNHVVTGLTNGTAYTFTVTASNAAGAGAASAASNSVTPVSNSARLINLSTRGQVQTGDNIMIGGFVIGGSVAKSVLIRAVGPNLANYGVTGVLANPALKLLSGQTQIASNDDWGSAANAAAIQATGKAPVSALESAILTTLSPGIYTAQVSGVGGGTGVGIVEVFEIDQAGSPLINISTRGQVQTGDNVMIGGFVIGGSASQTVLIRAVGPNLANYGVTGVLANPTLQLYAGQTLIASNDDWGSAANAAAIEATGKAPVSPLESAILVTLSPGNYTAKVSGVGGGTGVGIVEVFAQ